MFLVRLLSKHLISEWLGAPYGTRFEVKNNVWMGFVRIPAIVLVGGYHGLPSGQFEITAS
jgi:hypothetical protein